MAKNKIFLLLMLFTLSVSLSPLYGQTTLKALLKKSKLEYTTVDEGVYKVYITINGETSAIFLTTGNFYEGAKADIAHIILLVPVISFPKNYQHPPSLLMKICTINSELNFGRLAINESSGDVLYISSFWLKTATTEILSNELTLAHEYRLKFKEILSKYKDNE